MFGGGWITTNGGFDSSTRLPATVGREDVGLEPALVQRLLERLRVVGLRELSSVRVGAVIVLRSRNETPRSSSGRTGSWYHLLVRLRASRLGCPPGALSGATRSGSRATFASVAARGLHHPALAGPAGPSLLLSVVAEGARV